MKKTLKGYFQRKENERKETLKAAGVITAHEAQALKNEPPTLKQCDCTIRQAATALLKRAEKHLDQSCTVTGFNNIEVLATLRGALSKDCRDCFRAAGTEND